MSRLSAHLLPSTNLLSDNNEDFIRYPVYIGQQPEGVYNWQLDTVAQTQLDGATRRLPAGKGVGGGSLINGMIWNRGNQDDFDAWLDMGNPGWGWADLLPYFRKVSSCSRFIVNTTDTMFCIVRDLHAKVLSKPTRPARGVSSESARL